MTDEPRTVSEFVDELIAERGGRERFTAVQLRLCNTLALALRDPMKIDPSTVRDLVAMLPPLARPTAPVHALQITFVDQFDGKLERLLEKLQPDYVTPALVEELAGRITELEGLNKALSQQAEQLRRGLSQSPADENQHQRPSASQPTAFHEPPSNIVPLVPFAASDSPWAGWAEANLGLSGRAPGCAFGSEYTTPDVFDETGRRIKRT
jgi:hypothetical protein